MQRNYLQEIENNEIKLNDIPASERSYNICVNAIKQDGSALEYVPENIKIKLDLFLKDIEYIVVNTSAYGFELSDIQQIYAHTKKRLDKTICIYTSESLDRLLTAMQKANNHHYIHLVFVGDSTQNNESLAGFHYNEMIAICKKFPIVKHIHLLGCHVAKANATKEENDMIQIFKEKLDDKLKKRYGFITTLNASFDDNDLKEKFAVFCKQNKLNGVYILNKNENDYQMFVLKYAKDKFIKQISINIDAERIYNIRILTGQNKPLSFPTDQKKFLIMRGDNIPLKMKELELLRSLKNKVRRFDPDHPKYQQDKKIYPFLAKIKAESSDLLPSLLKRLTDAIQIDPEITWTITVQGPTQGLCVDTKNKRLEVAKTDLYSSAYVTSFLKNRKDSIIPYKLEQEQIKIKKFMESGNLEHYNQTIAKQLVVTVNKELKNNSNQLAEVSLPILNDPLIIVPMYVNADPVKEQPAKVEEPKLSSLSPIQTLSLPIQLKKKPLTNKQKILLKF